MLVISRQTDDAIVIDDDIEIIILQIKGNTVKIGVVAPLQIPVNRSEVYVKIGREAITAGTHSSASRTQPT